MAFKVLVQGVDQLGHGGLLLFEDDLLDGGQRVRHIRDASEYDRPGDVQSAAVMHVEGLFDAALHQRGVERAGHGLRGDFMAGIAQREQRGQEGFHLLPVSRPDLIIDLNFRGSPVFGPI